MLIKYKMAIGYFSLIPIVDSLLIIITLTSIAFQMRIILIIIFALLFVAIIKFSYEFASISSAAHSSYNKLNSIIVKISVSLKLKIDVCNMIERQAQTDIAVTVFDIIASTNNELYLFYGEMFKNFFLFISLYET